MSLIFTLEQVALSLHRCDWCGWPLVDKDEAGCWPDNCSMRPMPQPETPAQKEVFNLRRALRKAIKGRAEGFAAARSKARDLVIGETDGDSPFDSTLSHIADSIERLTDDA